MTHSPNALNLIKSFEGFKAKAYKDPGSKDGLPITIGYGTIRWAGKPIPLGVIIDEPTASKWLNEEVSRTSAQLNGIGFKLNQNQFDALVSFIYNVGWTAFRNSTLFKRVSANPKDPDIRTQFNKWVNNDGKVMKGLIRRRKAEADLYFSV